MARHASRARLRHGERRQEKITLMRALFCCPNELKRELGGPKILIELIEELQLLGWDCTLLGKAETLEKAAKFGLETTDYSQALKKVLQTSASNYDVVEFEHLYLPYDRAEFPQKTLFVTRASLLAHHYLKIQLPRFHTLKDWLDFRQRLFLGKRHFKALVQIAQITIQNADLANVANTKDQEELIENGIPEIKTAVIPYGMSRSHRTLFKVDRTKPLPEKPIIAFIGTFDVRKGAADLPQIMREIWKTKPEARFKLLGLAGQFQKEDEIRARLPRKKSSQVMIKMKYRASELPSLLEDCSLGIFPSYIESFGFGVLEMLAASLPVVAYNSPGPPVMLPKEWLVEQGNKKAMAQKVIDFLNQQLPPLQQKAYQLSEPFSWENIAKETAAVYQKHWELKQSA